jgi:hypothetical protein
MEPPPPMRPKEMPIIRALIYPNTSILQQMYSDIKLLAVTKVT